MTPTKTRAYQSASGSSSTAQRTLAANAIKIPVVQSLWSCVHTLRWQRTWRVAAPRSLPPVAVRMSICMAQSPDTIFWRKEAIYNKNIQQRAQQDLHLHKRRKQWHWRHYKEGVENNSSKHMASRIKIKIEATTLPPP